MVGQRKFFKWGDKKHDIAAPYVRFYINTTGYIDRGVCVCVKY